MDLNTKYRHGGLVDRAGAMHRHLTNPIADRSIYTFAETGAIARTGSISTAMPHERIPKRPGRLYRTDQAPIGGRYFWRIPP